MDSSTLNRLNDLVYWTGEPREGSSSETPSEQTSAESFADSNDYFLRKDDYAQSIYVQLLEEMITTVVKNGEGILFSWPEWDAFEVFAELSYNARYLLARLLLRKNGWIRLDKLKYGSEMGDLLAIGSAIEELCQRTEPVEEEPGPVSPELLRQRVVAMPPNRNPLDTGNNGRVEERTIVLPFADDESTMELPELLDCLTTVELKDFAKQLKIRHGSKRNQILEALQGASRTQRTLNFAPVSSKQGKAGPSRGAPSLRTQADRLRELAAKLCVKCVRIRPEALALFLRVNLVYLRCTENAASIMTAPLLARFKKRTYIPYSYSRTPDIWASRAALIEYEKALQIEEKINDILAGLQRETFSRASPDPKVPSKSPTLKGKSKKAPVVKEKQKHRAEVEDEDDTAAVENPRILEAKMVKDIVFNEVYPIWKALVAEKDKSGKGKGKGRACLERFDCGYVYTRVVAKGAYALGVLKEYEREIEVYKELLAQRHWRRGRRGRWYDRRALVLMTHLKGDTGDTVKDKRRFLQQAHFVVKEALLDDDTHLIYRPQLVRRLKTLEKRLKLPAEELHTCLGELKQAEKIFIKGTRVFEKLVLSPIGEVISGKLEKYFDAAPKAEPTGKNNKKNGENMGSTPWKGKSIWKGKDDAEVTVEALSLWHYEQQGYKGYHSEGAIVRTLFGLLFCDIFFMDVPGSFETPFQSAPLDITEDTFFAARHEQIETRLKDIKTGQAAEILGKFDDEHRVRKTMIVGVSWDRFPKEDLVEIAQCLPPEGLEVICRILAQEYTTWGGGVPDLIVWNVEKSTCKFVEVKGPGDTLQENQKVWIDLLLGAGVDVEICHVTEAGKPKNEPKLKRGRKRKSDVMEEVESNPDEPWAADAGGEDVSRRTTNTGTKDVITDLFNGDEPMLTTVRARSTSRTRRNLAVVELPPVSSRSKRTKPNLSAT